MADSIYTSIPQQEQSQHYWSGRSLQDNLEFCDTDALLKLFDKYLAKDKVLLEAGCGLAKWVIYFRDRHYRIIGLDRNQQVLNRAKSFDQSLSILTGDVAKLPFLDESIDIYISLGVIEHFKNGPYEALKEACRILKKSGLIIVEVPYLNTLRKIMLPLKILYRAARRLIGRLPKKYFFAEYRYSKRELHRFLIESGFEITEIFPKDDILKDRSIGLWLDFPFLRAKKASPYEHKLNRGGKLILRILEGISPWTCCGCVAFVARKKK